MTQKAVLLRLLGVCLLWGLNYVASAYLLRDFSPIFLSYTRLLISSVFLVFVALIGRKIKRPTRKEWGLLVLTGLFGTLFNQFFYFTGLQHSTVGNASLIIALSPVATAIMARMFLGETITAFKLFGALISFAGVVVIVAFGSHSIDISHGDVDLLLAMVAISVSLLFTRRLTESMPSYDITILATVIGTMLMTPAALMEGVHGEIRYSGHLSMWLILAAAAVIGQGLAGFWWNQGIAVAGASTSAIFMNIPPFVAIVFAYLLLGDPIRGSQIAGGALILLGVALANKRKQWRARTLDYAKGNEI